MILQIVTISEWLVKFQACSVQCTIHDDENFSVVMVLVGVNRRHIGTLVWYWFYCFILFYFHSKGKLGIFYFFFYLGLAGFFCGMLAVFMALVPRDAPRYFSEESQMATRSHPLSPGSFRFSFISFVRIGLLFSFRSWFSTATWCRKEHDSRLW